MSVVGIEELDVSIDAFANHAVVGSRQSSRSQVSVAATAICAAMLVVGAAPAATAASENPGVLTANVAGTTEEVGRVQGNAIELAMSLDDAASSHRATTTLLAFLALAAAHDLSGAPPLVGIKDASGALMVEWIFSDRRVGFVFDNDPSESGWYFASTDGTSLVGQLDTIDLKVLVTRAISKP